jgi:hypothetical protein
MLHCDLLSGREVIMMMKRIKLFFMMVFLTGMAFSCSYAATRYVDINSTNATSPYDSWGTAATNIQIVVSASSAGDVVMVNTGVYYTTNQIKLDKNITVMGVSTNPEDVVVTKDMNFLPATNSRIFWIGTPGGNAMVANLTVSNGSGGTENNDLRNGGGIFVGHNFYSYGGIISNCIITHNTSKRSGGGIEIMGGGPVKISNCIIKNNTLTSGEYGGGIDFYGGGETISNIVIESCLIYSNEVTLSKATSWGGGINMGFSGRSVKIGRASCRERV